MNNFILFKGIMLFICFDFLEEMFLKLVKNES